MPRVKLLKTFSGPTGHGIAGAVVDLSEAQAKAFIKDRAAVLFEPPSVAAKVPGPKETATAPGPQETRDAAPAGDPVLTARILDHVTANGSCRPNVLAAAVNAPEAAVKAAVAGCPTLAYKGGWVKAVPQE